MISAYCAEMVFPWLSPDRLLVLESAKAIIIAMKYIRNSGWKLKWLFFDQMVYLFLLFFTRKLSCTLAFFIERMAFKLLNWHLVKPTRQKEQATTHCHFGLPKFVWYREASWRMLRLTTQNGGGEKTPRTEAGGSLVESAGVSVELGVSI